MKIAYKIVVFFVKSHPSLALPVFTSQPNKRGTEPVSKGPSPQTSRLPRSSIALITELGLFSFFKNFLSFSF